MRILKTLHYVGFWTLLGLISGCTTFITPPQQLQRVEASTLKKQKARRAQQFSVQGKIGFSDGRRGGSAMLRWEQVGDQYQVSLFGPLGSGVVQISGDKGGVTLKNGEGVLKTAKKAEALLKQELGLTIPVSGLSYWLQGLPAPGAPPREVLMDLEGHIWGVIQQGWTIRYQSYQSVNRVALPYKLVLQNGTIRLKFVLTAWKIYPI